MNIIDTKLSARVKNVLYSQGIETVESLLSFYNQGIEMRSIRNMGSKSLKEIREFCKEYDSNDVIITSNDFSKLDLNQRIINALFLHRVHTIGTLKNLSESDINKMSDLTLRDRLILRTIRRTLHLNHHQPKESYQIQLDYIEQDFDLDSISKQIFDFFVIETPSENTLSVLNPIYLDLQRGHISELEFLFRAFKFYSEERFNMIFGTIEGGADISRIKSNNQLILLFLQNKLKTYTKTIEVTVDESLILLESLQSQEDKWLLSRLLGLFKLSALKIAHNYHIVDQKDYSAFLKVLRNVEGLPKKKHVKLNIPKVILDDSIFLRLLQLNFPVIIHESGHISNYVSEIPVVEKIYSRLKESGKPMSFSQMWQIEAIQESSQPGIRIKIMRDSRFIIYGKLGYLGLVDWDFKIDQIISGTIPDSTFTLIKIYKLSGLTFGTLSKIYSRLGKDLKMSSWRNNLLASRDNVIVSNNTAKTIVDHSDIWTQTYFLISLRKKLEDLLNENSLTGKQAMELALEVALIDYRNFNAVVANQIEDLLSFIRKNIRLLSENLQKIQDGVDYKFLEVCFGFKISRANKTDLVLGIFTEMIEDGEITFEEREVINKWIDEGELSLVQVKHALSQGLSNKSLHIDKQISYIFQHRGVEKLSEKVILEDLKYLLFDIQNMKDYLDRSNGFTLQDGFIIGNTPDKKVSSFELKVVGQEFLINLKTSLWDNVSLEYSEEINGPAITVNSNSSRKYISLIEDSIISFLLIENLMDPSSITKIRNRINMKLKSQHYELFE